ncbi:tetratricopeptide repeat protein [Methylacidiphilales bacterium]|nr:tetratricopeptide repeat protein [Candidatus Methylacidiphilales bacterium]
MPRAKKTHAARGHAKKAPPVINGIFLLQVIAIVAAGLWIYQPSFYGDWLWDDNLYVTGNKLLLDPARLWKAWFAPGSFIEYYPLEESVQWVQWQLWHGDTLGYHLTNVILHIANAFLVWRLLNKFGLRLAWLGGLLFLVHPIQVESVAWISELKNTLSLPFFLLAMDAWIDYENHGKRKDYLLALGLFLVAMLCKISMMMFPFVILLYAWWKRNRIGRNDLLATVPFFVISAVLGCMTILAGSWYRHADHSHLETDPVGSFLSHLSLGGLSIAFYFAKCFWPVDLTTFYPRWSIDPSSLIHFLPWPILGGVIYWLWTNRAGWGRHALLGLGFFLLNLVPFIGLNSISYMVDTWVMDHFLYIPLIGLIGLVVAGLSDAGKKLSPPARSFGIAIVTVAMAMLTWESHSYAKLYVDQETLCNYTALHSPAASPPHLNLAYILLESGRAQQAMDQYQLLLKFHPNSAVGHNNLGNTYAKLGRNSEAIEEYQRTLQINPDYAMAYYNLGNVFREENRLSEAIEEYRQSLQINPDSADAHSNLGGILFQMHRIPEALEQLQLALKINPIDASNQYNVGMIFMGMGQLSEAIEHFEQALKINPNLPGAQEKLDQALKQTTPAKN